jgi:hypothetical protein
LDVVKNSLPDYRSSTPARPTLDVAENPNNQLQVTSTTTPVTPPNALTPATPNVPVPGSTVDSRLTELIQGATIRDLTQENPAARVARETAMRRSQENVYGSTRQAEEALAQQGIMPGTAQYNRALATALGGANNANRDLLNDASGVQRDMYNQALERGTAREGTLYSRQRTVGLDSDNRIMTMSNAIKDPQAKARFLAETMQGGRNPQETYTQMFDANGALKPEYASPTPATLQVQGIIDQVNRVGDSQVPPWDEARRSKEIADASRQLWGSQTEPLEKEEAAAALDALKLRLTNGEKPTAEDLKIMPVTDFVSLPGSQAELSNWLAQQGTGGWIKTPDGKAIRIVSVASKWIDQGMWDGPEQEVYDYAGTDANGNPVTFRRYKNGSIEYTSGANGSSVDIRRYINGSIANI